MFVNFVIIDHCFNSNQLNIYHSMSEATPNLALWGSSRPTDWWLELFFESAVSDFSELQANSYNQSHFACEMMNFQSEVLIFSMVIIMIIPWSKHACSRLHHWQAKTVGEKLQSSLVCLAAVTLMQRNAGSSTSSTGFQMPFPSFWKGHNCINCQLLQSYSFRLLWHQSLAAARCGWPPPPWCGWTKIKPGAGLGVGFWTFLNIVSWNHLKTPWLNETQTESRLINVRFF